MIQIIGAILAVVGILLFSNFVGGVECRSKWEQSGFEVQYGFLKGCLIKAPEGKWIPAENYREMK